MYAVRECVAVQAGVPALSLPVKAAMYGQAAACN